MNGELAPGTRVLLRIRLHGEPGTVVGASRGKVEVDWCDLGIVGRHPPESLVCAGLSVRARLAADDRP